MFSFIKCGIVGWGLEVFWTGFQAMLHGDTRLTGHSSLWMFPIYGMAAAIAPAYEILKPLNFVFRGLIYMMCIFAVEYITGTILKSMNLCPWDYSRAALNVDGLIRLDYAPIWFCVGLLFEWILCRL